MLELKIWFHILQTGAGIADRAVILFFQPVCNMLLLKGVPTLGQHPRVLHQGTGDGADHDFLHRVVLSVIIFFIGNDGFISRLLRTTLLNFLRFSKVRADDFRDEERGACSESENCDFLNERAH